MTYNTSIGQKIITINLLGWCGGTWDTKSGETMGNNYFCRNFCLVKKQEILPYKSDEHVQGEEESMVERYFEHLSQQMQ